MYELIFLLLAIPAAILFDGLRRVLLAKMHNRTGPPLLQTFYDMGKLFGKSTVERKNMIFNMVPYLAFICTLFMLLCIPFAILDFDYNFLVLGYVFILHDTMYIFGAVASRSPFASHSSFRELLLMLGYEIALMIIVSIFFIKTGALSFGTYDAEFMFLKLPLASILLILTGFIVLRVTPYDVVRAEPEISAGFFAEYSGTKLALVEIAEFIKNLVFYILVPFLIFGRNYAILIAPFLLFFYAVMQASSPRYSTFATARTFVLVAIISFIDVFLLI